jgi:hypothetical protein
MEKAKAKKMEKIKTTGKMEKAKAKANANGFVTTGIEIGSVNTGNMASVETGDGNGPVVTGTGDVIEKNKNCP